MDSPIFKNLAGIDECDVTIKKELDEAGLSYEEFDTIFSGEVPTKLIIIYNGWIFYRAWKYWKAYANTGNTLLFKYANELYESNTDDVRIYGSCDCPSPDRIKSISPWTIGIGSYHIDTQNGLNNLVKAINKQCEEILGESSNYTRT
jgi:hypothetical protein